MALVSLSPELILYLADFLCDNSLNGLIHTGNVILADILVYEKGMDVNSQVQHHGTPLFEAIRSNQDDMFRWLIDNGADIMQVRFPGLNSVGGNRSV